MNSEETLLLEQLRIVLLGKTGPGKTSFMNILLRSSGEHEHFSSECQKPCDPNTTVKIQGENMVVVDTPDLCSPGTKNEAEVWKQIKECVSHTSAPHVFLFVVDYEPFTKQMRDSVKMMKNTFGKKVLNHTMILFNCIDNSVSDDGMEQLIKSSKDLRNFVKECDDRFYIMNDTDHSQFPGLLQKIKDMVQKNWRRGYTAKMIQEAEEERSRLQKRVSLAVKGSALAGTVLGGAVSSYFAGDIIGLSVTGGSIAGAALGCVGITAVNHIMNWWGSRGT